MLLLGFLFSFYNSSYSHNTKNWKSKIALYASILGFIAGVSLFAIRLFDPKGTNLALLAFNRKLIIFIAGIAILTALAFLLSLFIQVNFLCSIFSAILIFASLMYLIPPVLQFTREFVYFGEAGISTNALLRALGFSIGIFVCLLLSLSAYKVHTALNTQFQKFTFLFVSTLFFALEFSVSSVAALQRLKIIPLTDSVFKIMIWRGENTNAFLFLQLALALIMLVFVLVTHWNTYGTFRNNALLRKEKARLRNCRRWSFSLLFWGLAAIFIVIVLHYYDTKPPAEIQPEPYELDNNIISIPLSQVSDGHLHKFSYVTPNGFDVRFLVVKKPAGNAYGVGLDACDICGIAGYYERGNEEVICRRCDVVMNKNTIGFKGGCNPVPFKYEIKNSKIFIDVQELITHEGRFK